MNTQRSEESKKSLVAANIDLRLLLKTVFYQITPIVNAIDNYNDNTVNTYGFWVYGLHLNILIVTCDNNIGIPVIYKLEISYEDKNFNVTFIALADMKPYLDNLFKVMEENETAENMFNILKSMHEKKLNELQTCNSR